MQETRLRILLMLALMFANTSMAYAFDHQHRLWQQVLSANVQVNGAASRVDYRAIKSHPEQLAQYLASLSEVTQAQFQHWSTAQQLAFLINAYNAFTVNIVVEHYPIDSIKDIGNFFRSTWKIDFIPLFAERVNLDHIEHELIRGNPKFNEPRIHFALVCASIGCPKLQDQAFTGANLEELLEKGAQEFLLDPSRNRYNAKARRLELSSIFKWYGEDFEKHSGSVQAFVAKYMRLTLPVDTDITFLPYDWKLNIKE